MIPGSVIPAIKVRITIREAAERSQTHCHRRLVVIDNRPCVRTQAPASMATLSRRPSRRLGSVCGLGLDRVRCWYLEPCRRRLAMSDVSLPSHLRRPSAYSIGCSSVNMSLRPACEVYWPVRLGTRLVGGWSSGAMCPAAAASHPPRLARPATAARARSAGNYGGHDSLMRLFGCRCGDLHRTLEVLIISRSSRRVAITNALVSTPNLGSARRGRVG